MPLYCIHTYANSTVYGTVFKREFLHVYWAAEVSMDCYCRQALLWFPKEDGEKYKPKHLNTIVFQIFINFYICNYWSEKIILILFIMKFVARYIWKVQICRFRRRKIFWVLRLRTCWQYKANNQAELYI